MKNVFLFIMLILSVSLSAQEDKTVRLRSHEIKINALTLVMGNPELTYEYLINESSGVGLAVNVNIDNNELLPFNYLIMPYYRLYVGNKRAAGFFFEGSLAYLSEEVYEYDNNNGTYYRDQTGFGVGVAVGGKFLIKQSIVFEFFGGLGRNFNSGDNGSLAYPRVGVSVGKRF